MLLFLKHDRERNAPTGFYTIHLTFYQTILLYIYMFMHSKYFFSLQNRLHNDDNDNNDSDDNDDNNVAKCCNFL